MATVSVHNAVIVFDYVGGYSSVLIDVLEYKGRSQEYWYVLQLLSQNERTRQNVMCSKARRVLSPATKQDQAEAKIRHPMEIFIFISTFILPHRNIYILRRKLVRFMSYGI